MNNERYGKITRVTESKRGLRKNNERYGVNNEDYRGNNE